MIDLSARFGTGTTEVGRRTCIVIVEVESEQQDMGIMVDAVNEVMEISQHDVEPAPSFGAKIGTDFIDGIGKVNSHFVILLNVNKMLALSSYDV